MRVTDDDLLGRIRAGDQAALDALFRRHLASVWAYTRALCAGHEQMAEEVVSATWLAALADIRLGRCAYASTRGTFAGWLNGIARHKVADYRRAVTRVAEAPGLAPLKGDGGLSARATELREAIASVLERMPGDESQALVGKYLQGATVREIASVLGRSEKAAEAVLYRARETFRDLWGRDDGIASPDRE